MNRRARNPLGEEVSHPIIHTIPSRTFCLIIFAYIGSGKKFMDELTCSILDHKLSKKTADK